ncbi:MAG TPA: FAD-binding oxidoreductase [Deltaproteobacteria bacterium]|nr:FAD-binding oxidoreductase [Deltaproteobacteria bacterium]
MKADVIIIGAGVIGTACAYYLSRRGIRVLVLERSHLCAGATGATAAIISVGGTSGTPEPLRPFNMESHRLIENLEQDFEKPMEMIRGGSLFVALNEQEVQEIRSYYEHARLMGIDGKLLDGSEARRLEPLLSPCVAAAFYNPVSYHVNPFRLCAGYLDAAAQRCGKVEYGVEVQDIIVQKGRIDRVVTNRGDFHAEWVVAAAGAWTPQLFKSVDIAVPIVPARGQAILTEACDRLTNLSLSFSNHVYLRQTESGNFYLGSQTEFAGFEDRITFEKMAAFTDVPARAVPILGRLRAIRFFAGFRPISGDELPIIGPIPGCPKIIIASGHGKTGMRYSASTGKAVSELIADGTTELSIEAFQLKRFQKNKQK